MDATSALHSRDPLEPTYWIVLHGALKKSRATAFGPGAKFPCAKSSNDFLSVSIRARVEPSSPTSNHLQTFVDSLDDHIILVHERISIFAASIEETLSVFDERRKAFLVGPGDTKTEHGVLGRCFLIFDWSSSHSL